MGLSLNEVFTPSKLLLSNSPKSQHHERGHPLDDGSITTLFYNKPALLTPSGPLFVSIRFGPSLPKKLISQFLVDTFCQRGLLIKIELKIQAIIKLFNIPFAKHQPIASFVVLHVIVPYNLGSITLLVFACYLIILIALFRSILWQLINSYDINFSYSFLLNTHSKCGFILYL